MDLSGSLRGFCPLLDGPCPALVLADGQEGNQAQKPVAGGNQPVQAAFPDSKLLQEFFFFLGSHLGNIFFDGRGNNDHLSLFLIGDRPDCLQERNFAFVLSDIVLRNIGSIDYGFRCQQKPAVQDFLFFIVCVIGPGRFSAFSLRRCTVSMSEKISSRLIVSISRPGFTVPST